MGFASKKFTPFYLDDIDQDIPEIAEDNFYSYADPFDFYRKALDPDQYLPMTQRGLRKSFTENIIGIEFFLEMATSLRPLVDEARDIDEITRMFSQQKLASRSNPHSVAILREMIQDPNPEIALYAAEGLNSIENSYIEKILMLKEKIEAAKKPDYLLYFQLGKLFLQFATLLEGQDLILNFYINEAIVCLVKAYKLKSKSYVIIKTLGKAYLMLKKYKAAANIFNKLFQLKEDDIDNLFKLAECYYNLGKYDDVKYLSFVINRVAKNLDNLSEMIVYQWML